MMNVVGCLDVVDKVSSSSSHKDLEHGGPNEQDETAPKDGTTRSDTSGYIPFKVALYVTLLIVLIGVSAGVTFLVLGVSGEVQGQDRKFAKQADELTNAIVFQWQQFSLITLWMHETCHGRSYLTGLVTPAKSIGCTRQEFQDFFDYVSSNYSGLVFQNALWSSNVSHQERPALEAESRAYFHEVDPNLTHHGIVQPFFNPNTTRFETIPAPNQSWYFAQHYMLPEGPIAQLFTDTDVTASATQWPRWEAAIHTMAPVVSNPLPTGEDSVYLVQMLHPGIQRQDDPQFNGVAVVMVRVLDLLKLAVTSKVDNLDVYIYDVTEVEDPPLGDEAFISGVSIRVTPTAQQQPGAPPTSTSMLPEIEMANITATASRSSHSVILVENRKWLVVVTDPLGAYKPQLAGFIVGAVVIIAASTFLAVLFFTKATATEHRIRLQHAAQEEKAAFLEKINTDLNRQVEQRVQELRETTREAARAEAKSESMIQTMSMLSHELRTPLQGIMGVTSMALAEYESLQQSSGPLPQDFERDIIHVPIRRSSNDSFEKTPTISKSDAGSITVTTAESSHVSFLDKVSENLSTIQASSLLLLTLINNVLDVRKCSVGMMERFELECVDLKEIVQRCVETLKPISDISDVALNICPAVLDDGKFWVARGAALPIQQVLINLTGNSIKYGSLSRELMDSHTTVDINIRRTTLSLAKREARLALCSTVDKQEENAAIVAGDKDVLIVDVRDHGNGIPVEEADKVFGAFSQLKKHAGRASGFAQPLGTGLGLQLVTNMVGMMNGAAWANNCDSPQASDVLRRLSEEATEKQVDVDGSVFSFFLECAPLEEVEEFLKTRGGGLVVDFVPNKIISSDTDLEEGNALASAKQSHPDQHDIPVHLAKVKVLIVDDTLINVKVIQRMLRSLGFRCIRCSTVPQKALELLEEDLDCDMILTDYQMPGMDGLEFSSHVKRLYTAMNKASPLLVLCTADYSPTLITSCAEIGIEGMLRKPITQPDLARFVEEHRKADAR